MSTQSSRRPTIASLSALVTLMLAITGCQQSAESAGAPATGPCSLLKQGEVTAVFAGAKAGKADTSREEYGITACIWETAQSSFVAQYWQAADASAQDEASGLMLGVMDPLKPAARNSIQYETFAGIGDQAIAAVEKKDEQRGVLSDMAMLVVKRGDKVLVLIAPELARMERANALAALQSLGQSSVSRL